MSKIVQDDRAATDSASSWSLDQDVQAAALFPLENPNPVLRFARGGKVLFANPASRVLLSHWGVSEDGMLPDEWQEVMGEVLDSGQQGKKVVTCGNQVFEVDLVPILAGGYVNIYGREITAQRAEREVLHTIMEHTRAQLAYLDPQFNFVVVNSAYAAGSGHSKEELVGRNHFDLFPNAENCAIFERVRDSKQAVEFRAKPFEFVDQPERGTTYWDWTLTPVFEANGPVKGLVLSLVDVTERVRAEKLSSALNTIYTAMSANLDPTEILQTLLVRSVEALGSDAGGIGLREGDTWVLRYAVGLPESALGLAMNDTEAPVSALVARERKPVAISTKDQTGANRELMDRYGIRAVLALPLVVQDTVVGILSFNFYRSRLAFSEAEMDFAQKLAVSCSLALDNVRLVSELEQRVQERTAELQAIFDSLPDAVYVGNAEGITRCNQAALDILGCATIEELHDRVPNLAEKIQNRFVETGERIPTDQEPFVRALAGERAVLEMVQRNLRTGQDIVIRSACAPIRRGDNVIGAVAVNTDITQRRRMEEDLRRSQRLYQILQDAIPDLVWSANSDGIADYVNPRWQEYTGLTLEDLNRAGWQSVNHPEDAAHLADLWAGAAATCAPFEAEFRYRRHDGAYRWFWGRAAPLIDESGGILKWVGVMTDIEDRKCAEEVLQTHDEELHAYSRRMVRVIENERRSIARELHDEAGQALTSLKIGLGMIQKSPECPEMIASRLEEQKQIADQVTDELRKLATDLRPGALDRAGLVPALRQYVQQFGERTGLDVQFVASGFDDWRCPMEVETNLYRIAQEALTNIARHANAHHVGLIIQAQNGQLGLVIEDDGVGFDLDEAVRKGHLGLVGIRERAEMLGGAFAIETSRGRGTTIFVDVPCNG